MSQKFEKLKRDAVSTGVAALYGEIRSVLEHARASAYRAVNFAMVRAYWQVGGLIVEHEQGGRKRAAYGEAVLDDLSQRLSADFGKGFTTTNLKYMRLFYLAFRIRHALRDESAVTAKVNALRSESANCHSARDELPVLRPELSWTHYRLLLSVEDRTAREWYMQEAATHHWSTRALDRQISVLYYERLLASRKKAPVRKEASAKLNVLIGSKKFTEGWNSWRVSTMGLMNVGATEGSQIRTCRTHAHRDPDIPGKNTSST